MSAGAGPILSLRTARKTTAHHSLHSKPNRRPMSIRPQALSERVTARRRGKFAARRRASFALAWPKCGIDCPLLGFDALPHALEQSATSRAEEYTIGAIIIGAADATDQTAFDKPRYRKRQVDLSSSWIAARSIWPTPGSASIIVSKLYSPGVTSRSAVAAVKSRKLRLALGGSGSRDSREVDRSSAEMVGPALRSLSATGSSRTPILASTGGSARPVAGVAIGDGALGRLRRPLAKRPPTRTSWASTLTAISGGVSPRSFTDRAVDMVDEIIRQAATQSRRKLRPLHRCRPLQ